MNPIVTLAVDGGTSLSTLIGTTFSDMASQFQSAAPVVIAAAAGIVLVTWGVPKVIGFFKRTAK